MLSILKASAGSGKTYALTREYIKMLLGTKDEEGRYRLNRHASDRHRAILAITFTNKATDEMKQRIVHELAVLAELEPDVTTPSDYLGYLTETLRCTPGELKAEAARALRQLLFDFNFFHISTIDSFFQQILRTFAYEAEIEGDYEVDIDTRTAIARATDRMFAALNTEPSAPESKEIMQWTTEYLIDQLENSKSVALFNRDSTDFDNFVKSINNLSNETFMSRFDEMTEYFHTGNIAALRKALKPAADKCFEGAVGEARRILDIVEQNPLPDKGTWNSYLIKAAQKMAGERKRPGGATIPNIASGTASPGGNKAGKEYLAANPALEAAVADSCRSIVSQLALVDECTAIGASIFVLGLFRSVYRRLEEMRSTENVLLLSDTNTLLRRIIGDDDAPFIFERVGISLRHFLIDEFQDTSRMQWENLRPLVNESQGSGHDNLIIGDEKQCIYRFRGSAPQLLRHHVERETVPPISIKGDTPAENTNWRSSADVVTANNTIFSSVAEINGITDIYSNVSQQTAPKNLDHRGYVSLRRYMGSDITAEEYTAAATDRMLEQMSRQLQAGYRGADIAVLTRTRGEGQTAVNALMEAFSTDPRFSPYRLRVVSDDSLSLDAAPAVRRIVAVLRAISSAQTHDADKAGAQDAPAHYRTRAELKNLINRYEQGIGAGNTPSEALADAVGHAGEPTEPPIDLSKLSCVNLPSLIERIIAHYFPQGTVPQEQMLFILAFEDAVADYCALNSPDVQSFLRWWDETGHATMVAGAPDANAVRVMTIHKSKGLEFKCVHIPYLNRRLVEFKDAEWFVSQPVPGVPEELMPPLVALRPAVWMRNTGYFEQFGRMCDEMLLDEINVLYVAFTRAIDELTVSYLCHEPAKKKPADDISYPTAGQLIKRALDHVGLTDNETVWGAPTSPRNGKPKPRRAIDPQRIIDLPPYRVDERNELWDNTVICTEADEQLGAHRGIVCHDILANVGERADLEAAVGKAVRSGSLPPSEAAETLARLTADISAVSEAARWFDPRSRALCERSIVMPSGKETFRPDRVVICPDGSVDVIDYKFGEEHPGKYRRQVSNYVGLLRSMGYERVNGYLWYITARRVEKV